jgi:hypothetical protein
MINLSNADISLFATALLYVAISERYCTLFTSVLLFEFLNFAISNNCAFCAFKASKLALSFGFSKTLLYASFDAIVFFFHLSNSSHLYQ